MRSPALRAIQFAGTAAALLLLGLAIRSAWSEVAALGVRFRPAVGVASVGSLVVTLLGVIGIWRILLRDLGVGISYASTLQLWSFSNLGRYLPGKVWQVVGLVVVARDLGVPPGVAATGGFLVLGLMIGTGALVGLLTLPGEVAGLGATGAVVGALAAGLFVPVAWPGAVSWILRRLPPSLGCAGIPPLGRGAWLRAAALFALSWLAHGAAFLHFASAFGPVRWSDLPPFTGAYVLAHVTGLVAIFAPGGIGVREGILAHFVGSVGPAELPAHVVAVAARLWSIAAEVLVLVLAVTLRLARRRAAS